MGDVLNRQESRDSARSATSRSMGSKKVTRKANPATRSVAKPAPASRAGASSRSRSAAAAPSKQSARKKATAAGKRSRKEKARVQEREIAFEVLRSLRKIIKRVSEHSKHLSRDVGLTVPQLMCLKSIAELERAGEVTAAHVSEQVYLSPPTVSRIIDRLERDALVTRTRLTSDRRKVHLALTPAGLDRYNTLPAPLQEIFVARFSALEKPVRMDLLRALETITDLMDARHIDASPLLAPESEAR